WAQVNAKGDTAITVPTGTYSVESKDTRFNPATDISGDQINVHYTGNLKDGTEVRYDNGGGTDVGPLQDGKLYYVQVVDGQHIKLYRNYDSNTKTLSTPITSYSGGSGENQRLFPTDQAAPTKDTSPRF